jgi:circadian clock protein KaiC
VGHEQAGIEVRAFGGADPILFGRFHLFSQTSGRGPQAVERKMRFLVLQMHELLSYLSQLGVLTILVLAQHGLVGPMDTPLDISYLSDAVLMLRYFEYDGTVRRALSVVKKRSGNHEHAIREFRLSGSGVQLGPPLKGFSGIFSGTPVYTGESKPLLVDDEHDAG